MLKFVYLLDENTTPCSLCPGLIQPSGIGFAGSGDILSKNIAERQATKSRVMLHWYPFVSHPHLVGWDINPCGEWV